MKILIIGGVSHSLINFRGELLNTLRHHGHSVMTCAGEPTEKAVSELKNRGIPFFPIRLSRASISPLSNTKTFIEIIRFIRANKPCFVLAYTIKPVIWGGVAARVTRCNQFNALITGLGYAFIDHNSLRGKLAGFSASALYRVSLKKAHRVFFQNPDDMQEFIDRKLIRAEQGVLVNGSGVDLEYYEHSALPNVPRFLMVCRLLADKGVREYASAAKAINEQSPDSSFSLAGAVDSNPASITQDELDQWMHAGVIEYHGQLSDIRPAFRESSVYVLPSYYREGTPRTILEAMAMGRPIITTDSVGCRETVQLTEEGKRQKKRGESLMEGENGFLVRPKAADALAKAMRRFIDQPELIPAMGKRSREIAEEKYDVHKVNAVMLEAMGL